jgi:uridine kinase
MLGDILLIGDHHTSAAELIAKRVIAAKAKLPKGYKFIVAISGEAGTGKSEISYCLAKRLRQEHIRVKVLHTDNYFNVPPLLLTEWRRAKGIESVGINEYDWQLINRNIEDFKQDRESMMPCIDIIPAQVDKLITDFKKIDLLIINGLYALKADGPDLRIFINLNYTETAPYEKEYKVLSRDDFRLQVLEKEHQNVLALKSLADLLIDKNFRVIDAKTGEILT